MTVPPMIFLDKTNKGDLYKIVGLSIPCEAAPVLAPVNLTATVILPSMVTCTEPCDLTVDVTWVNNTSGILLAGQVIGITVDGTIPSGGSTTTIVPIDIGETVSHSFTLTGLTAGTYTICPDPGGVACATITVEKVVTAGFGAAGMFLIGGLAIGFLLFTRKKKEEKRMR